MLDAFVEFKRLIEVPRRFLRIGQSVSRCRENMAADGTASGRGNGFAVSHITQRPVRHR